VGDLHATPRRSPVVVLDGTCPHLVAQSHAGWLTRRRGRCQPKPFHHGASVRTGGAARHSLFPPSTDHSRPPPGIPSLSGPREINGNVLHVAATERRGEP